MPIGGGFSLRPGTDMTVYLTYAIIAGNAPDLFSSLLVVGVMAQISVQVVLNIAVVTNSIPNTGVSLPFISYGEHQYCSCYMKCHLY